MQSLFEFRVSYQKKGSSCLLLISSCSFCLSNFYPSHFAEGNNKILSAQFGPIGSETQTHAHSEMLLNFLLAEKARELTLFYLTEKLLKLQKIIKI